MGCSYSGQSCMFAPLQPWVLARKTPESENRPQITSNWSMFLSSTHGRSTHEIPINSRDAVMLNQFSRSRVRVVLVYSYPGHISPSDPLKCDPDNIMI